MTPPTEETTNRLITPPSGLTLTPNAIPIQDANAILEWIRSSPSIPWERAIEGRRVAQFGSARYDYERGSVTLTPQNPCIPAILRDLLLIPGGIGTDLTQCIINEYSAEDGIPYHVDDVSFGPMVLVFVFGETRPFLLRRMTMRDTDGRDSNPESFRVDLEDRSSYVLEGDARYCWEHSVPVGKDRRISVTFRSIS